MMKMNQAEAELRTCADRRGHDSNKHRELVHNLRRAIHEYEDRIAALLQV